MQSVAAGPVTRVPGRVAAVSRRQSDVVSSSASSSTDLQLAGRQPISPCEHRD